MSLTNATVWFNIKWLLKHCLYVSYIFFWFLYWSKFWIYFLFQTIWIETGLLEHTKWVIEFLYYYRKKCQNWYSRNCSQIQTEEEGWKKDFIALTTLGYASKTKRHQLLKIKWYKCLSPLSRTVNYFMFLNSVILQSGHC